MTEVERLVAIEEIRALKARYWLGVDTQDAVLLRSVFADDAAIPTAADPAVTRTAEAFVAHIVRVFAGAVSIHQGSSPIITFDDDDDDRATGVWTLEDRIWAPAGDPNGLGFAVLHGWGHYHDVYRRTPQGWRIQAFELRRVRVDIG